MATRERKLTAEVLMALHETLNLEDIQQNGRGQIILTRLIHPGSETTLRGFAKRVLEEMQKMEPDLMGMGTIDVPSAGKVRYKVVVQV